ncbi:type 1 glutamine amidotransferase [Streptomyces chartreusis]|uniref:type 1 glutamine amidotransferase n=1 Tax=Streptomyces chartreusis TaxID=1969 RepID=UPI0035E357D1
MRALIIRHDHASSAGHVGERLSQRGYQPTVVTVVPERHHHTPDIPFDFPSPKSWDLVVSLGAPWSVYDTSTIGSWIGGELDLLRYAHHLDIPVLGICFGAQALAVALGGSVEPADRPEIGWVEVATDAPSLIAPGPWFQWHFDRCVLPPGAVELARNDIGPQAFRAGRALGVQFHPEVTADVVRAWLDLGGRDQCEKHNVDADALLRSTAAIEQAAERRAHQLVDAYLDRVVLT